MWRLLGYVKPISLFRSVRCIKLVIFTRRCAYNLQESDLELEIGIELNCKITKHKYTQNTYNNTKAHCFINNQHRFTLNIDYRTQLSQSPILQEISSRNFI